MPPVPVLSYEEYINLVGPALYAGYVEHAQAVNPLAPDPSAIPEYVAPADPMQPGEADADVAKLKQEMTIEKAAIQFAKIAGPLIAKAAAGGI